MLRSIARDDTNDDDRLCAYENAVPCESRVHAPMVLAASIVGRRAMALRAGLVAGGAGLLLAGCLVADPFDTPPTLRATCEFVDGRPCTGDDDARRGDRIRFRMLVGDPERNEDLSSYGWKAFTCSTHDGKGCVDQPFDAQHYDEQRGLGLELEIPATLPSDVGSVSVDFEARDDRGGIGTDLIVFHLIDVLAGPAGSP